MADVYGAGYNKEWIADPAEQADPATQFSRVVATYDTFGTIANADVLVIAKIQHKVRLLSIAAIGGDLGAGLTRVRNKAGTLTTVVVGDLIDGQVDGGLDLVRIADGDTDSDIAILVQFLTTN